MIDKKDEIKSPYNTNNILIKEKDIINILNLCNVNTKNLKINNMSHFEEAMTHKSYCKNESYTKEQLKEWKNELNNPKNLLELRDKSYERLEYLGDRVLKLIVSFYLFKRYPNENEGFMTRLQTKLEDKKNLSKMSKKIGLGKYFIISNKVEINNGRNSDIIHEDVYESFIGALYLSNGYEIVLLFVVNMLETIIDYSEKLYCDNNYKDSLMRHYHINKWKPPIYNDLYIEGDNNTRKYYIVGIKNENDVLYAFGKGQSKKEAEQKAAKMALIHYNLLKPDQYNNDDIFTPNMKKINKINTKNINYDTDIENNYESDSDISVYSCKSI
jgi:ribonuclease III